MGQFEKAKSALSDALKLEPKNEDVLMAIQELDKEFRTTLFIARGLKQSNFGTSREANERSSGAGYSSPNR